MVLRLLEGGCERAEELALYHRVGDRRKGDDSARAAQKPPNERTKSRSMGRTHLNASSLVVAFEVPQISWDALRVPQNVLGKTARSRRKVVERTLGAFDDLVHQKENLRTRVG